MNNTTKPFGQLSNAEKKELVCAWIDGKKIEFYNTEVAIWQLENFAPSWNPVTRYRIANESPMTIPWELIDSEFNYAAKDKDGDICFYGHAPRINANAGYWYHTDASDSASVCSIARTTVWAREFAKLLGGDCDWKESLTKRPS